MKILCCGGEKWDEKRLAHNILNCLSVKELVVIGKGETAQHIITWAKEHKITLRNTTNNFVDLSKIQRVVLFPSNNPKKYEAILQRAKVAGVPVIEIGKRVYVDMDDVLVDFHRAYKKKKSQTPKDQPVKVEQGFFFNLGTVPGAVEGIKRLANFFEVWILSAPFYNIPSCYTEKRLWVEKHLGDPWHSRLILSPNKELLMGDYLIDDHEWKHFQGKHLHFGHRDCPDWKAVLNYFGV